MTTAFFTFTIVDYSLIGNYRLVEVETITIFVLFCFVFTELIV